MKRSVGSGDARAGQGGRGARLEGAGRMPSLHTHTPANSPTEHNHHSSNAQDSTTAPQEPLSAFIHPGTAGAFYSLPQLTAYPATQHAQSREGQGELQDA